MTDETLFDAALEIPDAAGRRAFLDDACRGDVRLRQQVDELLAAHEQASGFLGDTELHTGGTASWSSEPPPGPGAVIAGRYRILDCLGEGGMGTVWLADQTEPVRRRVALKLIKPGMDSRSVLARFEGERQALAVMDHPNIAKVFDGGTTDRRPLAPREEAPLAEREVYVGRPFFVMEYVKGVPLTEYCDHQRLTVEARLQLFVHICRAVQHAHQKGVVHRDLKPSNILVCNYDGKPVPKIIDFGLAKALHQPFTETGQQTAQGLMLGTPVYMSPEQAGLNDLDIDTRADIYSLGVILYELLTGSPPFTLEEMRAAALTELIRIIREVEPPRPSTKLQSSTEMATVAANRGLEPKRLKKLVSGELDWIVMKCLEKERGRRYETAGALALDIERHLRNEPVEAGPPSTAYRLKKFLRRNRGAVAAATLIVLALVAGIIGTTSQALRAENARAEQEKLAERERLAKLEAQKERDDKEKARQREAEQRHLAEEAEADTRAFSDFLVHHVLAACRPEGVQEGLGVDVKLSQALEVAEKELERVFLGRPRAEADARHALGVTWRNLGKDRDAERNLRRALELRKQTLGTTHASTLSCMQSLGVVLRHVGQIPEATDLFLQVHDAQLAALGPENPYTLVSSRNLAGAYHFAGRREEAVQMLEQVRDVQRRVHPDDLDLLTTLESLATMYREAGRHAEAIQVLEAVRSARTSRQGPDHLYTLHTVYLLGWSFFEAERFPDAIRLFEQVRDGRLKKLGPEHPAVLSVLNNLAATYPRVGKKREGMKLLEQVRDVQLKTRGLDHPATLLALANVASAYVEDGRLKEAVLLFEQVQERSAAILGPNDADTLTAEINLTGALWRSGQHERALKIGEATLPRAQQYLGAQHNNTRVLQARLANLYAQFKRYDKAAEMLEPLATFERQRRPIDESRLADALTPFGHSLLSAGKPAEAEPVLRESLAIRERIAPGAYPTFNTQSLLGAAMLGQRNYVAAEPLLLQSCEGMKKLHAKNPAFVKARFLEALQRLVELYDVWNKPDEAAKWRKELEASKPAKAPGTPKPDPTKPG